MQTSTTTWTTTPPTVDGWYWHTESRLADRQIVRVDDGYAEGIDFAANMGGIWAGPIEPPAAWETPTD